ncbi:hypothetical protein AAZV13_02G055950 [Glycine max]
MLVWRSQKKTIRYNFLYRSQSLSKFCPLGMIKGKGFSGTKRYFGDLGTTVSGFQQGILKLAMEPSVLRTALMEGGPDRKILLDRSPGVDELYIEGYIQAMLDSLYRQEYLRVRVIDNQVILKNLPPNHSLINEITGRVKEFLVSKALLKGDPSTTSPSS